MPPTRQSSYHKVSSGNNYSRRQGDTAPIIIALNTGTFEIVVGKNCVNAAADDTRSCKTTPERIRTSDLRFRKPPLYPAELRAQLSLIKSY